MDRRRFLKVTAISGAGAVLSSCGHAERELIRFVPEENLTPGVSVWKPSICPLCAAGCGLIARVTDGEAEVVRNDRPGLIRMGLVKKLEGNPDHPINRGRLCPRGQAAIQLTYHPDRVRHPLRRAGPRGSGRYDALTWDEAVAMVVTRLEQLASGGAPRPVAALTRPFPGRRRELLDRFLAALGAHPAIDIDVFGDEVLRRANALSFGRAQVPTFDLARSRYVISFGADFLGTWNSPVAQMAAYGEMRQGRPGLRGTFVQVEARLSQTGANADRWIPIRPGTDGALALGLAHVILREGLRSADLAGAAGDLIDGWDAGLPEYAPEAVERVTGVPAARVARVAREIAGAEPAIALIGGPPLAQTNGLFHALAVNALHALVGNVGGPGGVSFTPQPRPSSLSASASATRAESGAVRAGSVRRLAEEILAGGRTAPQVLFLYEANPVFASPPAWRVGAALEAVPFIVSFSSFLDETSGLVDLVLPDHSFLESWVDHVPESGTPREVASVAAPAMRPLHDTRAMPDVLLEIARRVGGRMSAALPWQTFDEMLRATFEAQWSRAAPTSGEDPEAFWKGVRARGGWWGEEEAHRPSTAGAVRRRPARYVEAQFDGDATAFPFHFLPYASQMWLDGSLAHLPWMQETPDVLSTVMWGTWVEINPRTAAALGIAQGELVTVTSPHGALEAAALVSPGIAPDVVAMPVGQGHESFTRYASGRGANPIRLLAPLEEPDTGALAWAATRVRIARKGEGRLVLFGGALRERPHEQESR